MAVLEAHNVNVHFGDLHAVRDASVVVEAGHISALIGPNGAGKTTFFGAISGVQDCTGQVHLDGIDVSDASIQRRARLGLARTFQRIEVFGSMTAEENLLTAAESTARARREPVRAQVAKVGDLLAMLGLGSVARTRADSLPTGQARLVELGRALATSPKVVLLDEPASGLNDLETEQFAGVLHTVKSSGVGILLVEHDIDLVMRLSSTVHVLNLGEVIASGSPEEVRRDPKVQEAYLGAAA